MHHATLLWKINGIFRFLLSPVENKKSHFPAQGCKNMMSKRHPSLVPLAREHHEGLLLAVRLQQGKKALLRLWSHDPHWQAGYVVEFYEKHLRTHFMAEEQGLFPIAEGIKACKPHVDELLLHHRTLVEQVDRFRQPTRVRLDDALHAFGALLEEHIRKEDRVLFPLFEKHATQEMLRQVDISIKRFYPPDPPGHTTSSS